MAEGNGGAGEPLPRREHGLPHLQEGIKVGRVATALAPAILALRQGVNNIKEAFGIRTDKFDDTRTKKTLDERKKTTLDYLNGTEGTVSDIALVPDGTQEEREASQDRHPASQKPKLYDREKEMDRTVPEGVTLLKPKE